MQNHAIVELEEGSLTVTVATPSRRTAKIAYCIRLHLADLAHSTVVNALRSLGEEVLAGVAGVHVVLGERRIQHFVCTVPKMAACDVSGFLVREALRLTGMPSEADVLVAPKLLRRLPGGRLVLGATAVAKNVWEPVHEAFRSMGIEVLSLHSMEACLAMAATPEYGNHVAVLECNVGRARFVLCDTAVPVQVRRILISGGREGDSGALAAQLAMELPRTMDWLKETGHTAPSTLLLGSRVGVDAQSREMIRGDLERLEDAPTFLETSEGQAMPGLAVSMLLRAIGSGKLPGSLLGKPQVRLPYGSARMLGIAAAAAAGLACSWSAVINGREFFALKQRVEAAATEVQQHGKELAQIERENENAKAIDAGSVRLQEVLNLRRPISRLLCETSNCAGLDIHLEELKFASMDRVVVTGAVQAKSRKAALTAMADYSRQLRRLPYLEASGQENISEISGRPNCFRFRIVMSWRSL